MNLKLTKTTLIISITFVVAISIFFMLPNETGQGTAMDYIYGYEEDCGQISFWLYNDNPSGGLFGFWSYSAIYSVNKENTELLDRLIKAYENHDLVMVYYKNIRHPYLQYASETVIYDMKVVKHKQDKQ